jgi:cell division protein FtsB
MLSSSMTSRRRGPAARRATLLVVLSLAVVVVAVAANYGPVTHYLSARTRLQETTAKVAALEEQTAQLQAQLGKLSEAGYLEDLARQKLSYVRPGEDLYIIGEEGQSGTVEGQDGTQANAAATGAGEEATAATASPGFFERLLTRVAALF